MEYWNNKIAAATTEDERTKFIDAARTEIESLPTGMPPFNLAAHDHFMSLGYRHETETGFGDEVQAYHEYWCGDDHVAIGADGIAHRLDEVASSYWKEGYVRRALSEAARTSIEAMGAEMDADRFAHMALVAFNITAALEEMMKGRKKESMG